MIKISCPHCGQGYDCDDEFNGETITCQKCSKKFKILSKDKPIYTQEPPKEQSKNTEQQPQPPAEQEQKFSMKCPFCLSDVPFKAKRCRYCGTWISGAALTDRIFSIIIKILFASFIISILVFFTSAITVGLIQAIFK